VRQSDYEAHTATPAGKFVVGLGQDEMAFVDASEDINRLVAACVAADKTRFCFLILLSIIVSAAS
jgi:3-hydroxy-3-methylglutaryl CoA synthase